MAVKSVTVAVAVCILIMNIAADTVPPRSWTIANYPNPDTQGELCGGGREDVMYVCDPNGLLQEKEAQQLEVVIQDVMNTTECPCARNMCDQPGSPGYRIGVALMRQMNGTPNSDKGVGSTMRNNLHNAKLFAHTFLNRWNIGRCKEDLLILYSQDDTVLYTATSMESGRMLDGDTTAEISMLVQSHFTRSGNKFEGLRDMISHYKAVFNGDYEGMERRIVTPKYQAVIGGTSKIATFTLMTVTLTLLAALI